MAYLLTKLLPLALLPLGLSLTLLVVGLIGRWRWPVIAAALLLWVFSLGLVSQSLWRWLETPYQRRSALEAPQADAIVVLSGGRHPAPGPARLSEWEDPDRFLAGIDLFRAGKAPRLLFTGGASPFLPGQRPEGQHYLQQAALFGDQRLSYAPRPTPVGTARDSGTTFSGGFPGPRPLGRSSLARPQPMVAQRYGLGRELTRPEGIVGAIALSSLVIKTCSSSTFPTGLAFCLRVMGDLKTSRKSPSYFLIPLGFVIVLLFPSRLCN